MCAVVMNALEGRCLGSMQFIPNSSPSNEMKFVLCHEYHKLNFLNIRYTTRARAHTHTLTHIHMYKYNEEHIYIVYTQ